MSAVLDEDLRPFGWRSRASNLSLPHATTADSLATQDLGEIQSSTKATVAGRLSDAGDTPATYLHRGVSGPPLG